MGRKVAVDHGYSDICDYATVRLMARMWRLLSAVYAICTAAVAERRPGHP
jgi:hypothetical protein